MKNPFEYMKTQRIFITIKYYGLNDLATHLEIKSIHDNLSFFENFYDKYHLTQINDIDDYCSYLLAEKFAKMTEVVPLLTFKEDKYVISKLAEEAKNLSEQIGEKDIIKFINSSYKEIFEQNTNDLLRRELIEISVDYILLFKNGINQNVFEYICENFSYIILNNYDDFECILDRNSNLFLKTFSDKNISELELSNFSTMLDVFSYIYNKRNSNLKPEVEKLIPLLSNDIEKLAKSTTIENVIRNEHNIKLFYDFLKRIKHINANKFEEIYKNISKLSSESIKQNGHVSSFAIPRSLFLDMIHEDIPISIKILKITHTPVSNTNKWDARLNKPPKVSNSIIDLVSTNIPTDKYFTISHQQNLNIDLMVGSALIREILSDPQVFEEYLSGYYEILNFIASTINDDGNLLSDFKLLAQMLNNIFVLPNETDKLITQSLCYGAAMFTCTYSEKILRTIFKSIHKNDMYIPFNKATLGQLLSDGRQELADILGEYQLKHLRFFFCGEKNSDVGFDYRNKLAHWNQINACELAPIFICKLFYLLTSIINSIYIYFSDKSENKSTDG